MEERTLPPLRGTRKEIAFWARVHINTVDREIRRGNLVAHKIGRKVVIYRADALRWGRRIAGTGVVVLLLLLLLAVSSWDPVEQAWRGLGLPNVGWMDEQHPALDNDRDRGDPGWSRS